MGTYAPNTRRSTLPVTPCMPIGGREMERLIRKRTSEVRSPDQTDADIMKMLVSARASCSNRKAWVAERRRKLGSVDMLTLSGPAFRRAK